MADGFVGADPDELDRIADDLSRRASQLERTRQAMSSTVRSAPWRGAGAERFRRKWDTEYVRDLDAAKLFLDQTATTIRKNSEEQRRTSTALGNQCVTGSPNGNSIDELRRRYGDDITLYKEEYTASLTIGGKFKAIGIDLSADVTGRFIETMDPEKPHKVELEISGELAAKVAAKYGTEAKVGTRGTATLAFSFATAEERDAWLNKFKEILEERPEDTNEEWFEKPVNWIRDQVEPLKDGAEAADFLFDNRDKIDSISNTTEFFGGAGISIGGQQVEIEGSFGHQQVRGPDGRVRENVLFTQVAAAVSLGANPALSGALTKLFDAAGGGGGGSAHTRLDADASMKMSIELDDKMNAKAAVIDLRVRTMTGGGEGDMIIDAGIGGYHDTSSEGRFQNVQLRLDLTDPTTAELFTQLSDPQVMSSPERMGELLDKLYAHADIIHTSGTAASDSTGGYVDGQAASVGGSMSRSTEETDSVHVKPKGSSQSERIK